MLRELEASLANESRAPKLRAALACIGDTAHRRSSPLFDDRCKELASWLAPWGATLRARLEAGKPVPSPATLMEIVEDNDGLAPTSLAEKMLLHCAETNECATFSTIVDDACQLDASIGKLLAQDVQPKAKLACTLAALL